jgi:pimeloyl-ACP methyl ester carboxylesterase
MKRVFLLLLLFPLSVHAQYMDYWTGKLSFGLTVTVELNVTYEGANPGMITMDCPEQHSWDLKCDLIKWTSDSFNIALPSANVKIIGKKTNHDSILDAKWIQGDFELPITFNRSLTGIDPVRPQNPSLFVDYIVEDLRIHNSKDNIDLFGTLTIPKGYQMKGCAVLLSGSGPQDKEESMMGHKPFWVIADYLTRNGYAVMRFDDRGSYRSTGNFSRSTIYDFANDVNAAIDMAKERTGLDESKIGLIGHSEGGIVSQIVLKDRPLAFFISLAGPAASSVDVMYLQNKDLNSLLNISDVEFDKTVGPFLKKILTIVADPKIDSATAAKKMMKLYKKEEKNFSAAAKKRFQMNEAAGAAYWLTKPLRAFIGFNAPNYISALKIPVLALNGSKDKQVNSKLNLDVFRMYSSNNPLNEQVELPNKNHLFQTCDKGDISEYGKIEETFSPDALKIMLQWLNKVFSK